METAVQWTASLIVCATLGGHTVVAEQHTVPEPAIEWLREELSCSEAADAATEIFQHTPWGVEQGWTEDGPEPRFLHDVGTLPDGSRFLLLEITGGVGMCPTSDAALVVTRDEQCEYVFHGSRRTEVLVKEPKLNGRYQLGDGGCSPVRTEEEQYVQYRSDRYYWREGEYRLAYYEQGPIGDEEELQERWVTVWNEEERPLYEAALAVSR